MENIKVPKEDLSIQILSDVHLEFFSAEGEDSDIDVDKVWDDLPKVIKSMPPKAPILALLGDIGNYLFL